MPIPVGAAMVKKSKKASKLAPLERDVEPNLRKLTFVRARYARAPSFAEGHPSGTPLVRVPALDFQKIFHLVARLNFRTLSRRTAVPRAAAVR